MRASAKNHFSKWRILVDTFESISEATRLAKAIEAGDDVHQASVILEGNALWTVFMRNVIAPPCHEPEEDWECVPAVDYVAPIRLRRYAKYQDLGRVTAP